jgi:hypothetical protein
MDGRKTDRQRERERDRREREKEMGKELFNFPVFPESENMLWGIIFPF